MRSGDQSEIDRTLWIGITRRTLNLDWMFTDAGPFKLREYSVDQQLIGWLNEHPEIISEHRKRGGLG